MKSEAVLTRDERLMGLTIQKVTGGHWQHALTRFSDFSEEDYDVLERHMTPEQHALLEDCAAVYFESSWSKDPADNVDGWRGPLPWTKLEKWIMDPKGKGRAYSRHPLAFSDTECLMAFVFCLRNVKVRSYAHLQLWENFKCNVFGMGTRPGRLKEDEWTCSEGVLRVIGHVRPDVAIRHFKVGEFTWNQYTPSGKFGLTHGLEMWSVAEVCEQPSTPKHGRSKYHD